MLGEKDLIYFGAVLIWSSAAFAGTSDGAIKQATDIYNKIFNENE